MKNYLHKILVSFGLCFSILVHSQIYPTQITPVLHPPYAATINEYATTLSEKITASIYTNDLTVNNRQVQLKLYIESNHFNAISTAVITGYQPLYINGGENLQLSNADLAPYFQLENLTGISPEEYGQTLQEGLYKFCFEVYDYNTQQKISAKSCAMAYITLNDPPLLNTPFNHDIVYTQDPQNIVFTWTPRHIDATNVEYEFTLVEILDEQTPPENAFLYSQPMYQVTTNNTILLYGPAEPALIEGRRYAWRVRAQIQEGIGQGSPFINNGYSMIYDFTFSGNCPQPEFTLANPISASQCEITWQPNSNHTSYLLQYRKLGTEEWFEVQAFAEQVMLYDLEGGETYEFRVGGACYSDVMSFSNINTFTQQLDETPIGVTCGIQPDLNIGNQTEFTGELGNGQVFLAGDFPIHVNEASGSGSYSGEGWTKAPYLGTLKLAVEFTDIKINTDMQLIEGEVRTKYDPEWSNILSVNDVLDQLEDLGDIITDEDDQHQVILDDIVIGSADNIIVDDGQIVITDENGEVVYTMDYDEGESYTIIDANGNAYNIDSEGQVHAAGEGIGAITSATTNGVDSDGEVTQLQDVGMKVTFSPIPDGTYKSEYFTDLGASSSYPNEIKLKYKVIQDANGQDYPLIYKAVAKIPEDTIAYDWVMANVEITDNSLILDSLVFAIHGTKVNYTIIDETSSIKKLALKVPAFDTKGEDEVLALLKTAGKKEVVGAMMDVQIKKIGNINIKIVPVNNAVINIQEITDELDNIYNGAGVSFTVTSGDSFITSDTEMQCGNSGILHDYTSDQNNFIQAYKASLNGNIQSNTYYVFIMNNVTPVGHIVKGLMPINNQFAFIFPNVASGGTTEENKSNVNEVIAHEIGHGVFKLEHPWEQFNYADSFISVTDWLMDYGGGVKLPYVHWKQIGHPQFKLYLFQGDSAGESVYSSIDDKFLNEDGQSFSFVDYNGNIISLLKSNLVNVLFNYGTSTYSGTGKQAVGVLQGFIINQNENLKEYRIKSDGRYYSENVAFTFPNIPENLVDGVIMYLPCGDQGKIYKFQKTNLNYYNNDNPQGGLTDIENFPIVPFSSSSTAIIKNGAILTQNFELSDNLEAYSYDQNTADMTYTHCETPELFFILKIAQIRRNYSQYFSDFTDIDSWENPENVAADYNLNSSTSGENYIWADYLENHPSLQSDYTNHTNLENYFRQFYIEFSNYVENQIFISEDFWDQVTINTPENQIENQVLNEPIVELRNRPVDKKLIAIQVLINNSLPESQENAILKLCASFDESEMSSLLNLFINEIGLETIVNKFDDWGGDDNFTKILTLIAAISPEIQPSKEESIEYVNANNLIQIDDSIFFNEQADAHVFGNDISFSVFNNNYGNTITVPYNKLVAVILESNFKFNNVQYYEGDVLLIPAIIAYAIHNNANTAQIESTSWLVADGLLFALGVGEIKVLFSSANWLRKAFILGDVIGSGSNLLLDAGIEEELPENIARKWRLSGLFLSVPNGILALKQIGSGLINEFRIAKNELIVSDQAIMESKIIQLESAIGEAGDLLQLTLSRFDGDSFAHIRNWINTPGVSQNEELLTNLLELSDDAITKFAQDLADNSAGLKTFFEGNSNGIKAWEKLTHNDITQTIRTNTSYLNIIRSQLTNNPNVLFKFERVLPNIPSNKLDDFFFKLDNPKSIDHVRSLVGDFENIPGINISTYIANGMDAIDVPPPATWSDPYLYLPGDVAKTFTDATAKTLTPGNKIYRVLDQSQNPAGGYWTYTLPNNKTQLYGGTAVRPEWNAATHYVEYTIPPNGLKVWDGPAARQAILDNINQAHLPGGTIQIYIPDLIRQDESFSNLQLIPINL